MNIHGHNKLRLKLEIENNMAHQVDKMSKGKKYDESCNNVNNNVISGSKNNNNNNSNELKKMIASPNRPKQIDVDTKISHRPRSAAERFLGKLLIILTLVSFIFVGLILNCVQLILTLTIKLSDNRTWRRWHKKLNGQIVYATFSQPVALLYLWPRWELDIVLEDMKLMDDVQKNIFGIIIANHTFELDWMTCFVLADQLGNMGNYKCFSKDELKWLPIIGWTFWMADLIYVKRDWKQDRLSIADKLNQLLDYDQILLGIFAEGTRWTQEKHEDAVKFAKSRSIDPYKHHLFPRPRGFNYTLRHYLRVAALKDGHQTGINTEPARVFNLEIVMPDKPKFSTFLEGGLLRASVYCEEVHLGEEFRLEALNSKNEDDCPKLTRLLQDIFRRKDELIEEFANNGQKFPLKSQRSGHFPIKKPVRPCIYWLVGMSLTYGTFAYLANTVFANSLGFWSLVVVIITSGLLLLKRIEHESLPTRLKQRGEQALVDDTKSGKSFPLKSNRISVNNTANGQSKAMKQQQVFAAEALECDDDGREQQCLDDDADKLNSIVDKQHVAYKSSQAC